MGYSILVARPVGLGFEKADIGTYMGRIGWGLGGDSRIDAFDSVVVESNRIAQARNQIAKLAMEKGYDLLLMIDPDMIPDVRTDRPTFLKSGIEWLVSWRSDKGEWPKHVVGAPYCGGWPDFKPHVWRYEPPQERYTRAEAVHQTGMQQAGAIGSGLLLMPSSVFEYIPQPFFVDSYTDASCSVVDKTQDYVFCRRAWAGGVRVWCNWDCWSGHRQEYKVGVPGEDGLPLEMPYVAV